MFRTTQLSNQKASLGYVNTYFFKWARAFYSFPANEHPVVSETEIFCVFATNAGK